MLNPVSSSLIRMSIALFFLAGCNDSGGSQKSILNPYKSEETGAVTRDCSTLEPENPYSAGSGHYAGYEWADSRNASSCGGNSQSFIEGCERYLDQLRDYSNCTIE